MKAATMLDYFIEESYNDCLEASKFLYDQKMYDNEEEVDFFQKKYDSKHKENSIFYKKNAFFMTDLKRSVEHFDKNALTYKRRYHEDAEEHIVDLLAKTAGKIRFMFVIQADLHMDYSRRDDFTTREYMSKYLRNYRPRVEPVLYLFNEFPTLVEKFNKKCIQYKEEYQIK